MNTDNTTNILEMAIEYIFVAILLFLILTFVRTRDSYASTMNTRITMQQTSHQALEFSRYNTGTDPADVTQCVSADVVMEAIRKYRSGNIRIYVDSMKDGTSLLLDSITAGTHATSFTQEELTQTLDFDAYYHPYLVYDAEEITGGYTGHGTEVTGIAFIKYRR